MLNDKDEFEAPTALWDESLFLEATSLIPMIVEDLHQRKKNLYRVLRYRNVISELRSRSIIVDQAFIDNSVLTWSRIVRDFMVKYSENLDRAIAQKLGRT